MRAGDLPFPIAVVLAHREYEAWMLASIEAVCQSDPSLPSDLTFAGDPESVRDAKGWLIAQMPPGKTYKPRLDQPRLTAQIDLERAQERSRSFRRLCHALDELVAHVGQPGVVTP